VVVLGLTGAEWGAHSYASRFGSEFGTLRVPSISWISSLCPSISPLLQSICGVLAPIQRICSILHITLELFSRETKRAEANKHTFPNP
jgi:hypothetical protein